MTKITTFLILIVLLSMVHGRGNQPQIKEQTNILKDFIAFDSVVVSYLNWDFKSRGRVACEDVKNFNGGKNAKYVIDDGAIINKFIKALSLVEMNLIMKKEIDDIRMVLDFYSTNELKKSVCLNSNRAVWVDGNLYRSDALFILIEEKIPKTNAPFSDRSIQLLDSLRTIQR